MLSVVSNPNLRAHCRTFYTTRGLEVIAKSFEGSDLAASPADDDTIAHSDRTLCYRTPSFPCQMQWLDRAVRWQLLHPPVLLLLEEQDAAGRRRRTPGCVRGQALQYCKAETYRRISHINLS